LEAKIKELEKVIEDTCMHGAESEEQLREEI